MLRFFKIFLIISSAVLLFFSACTQDELGIFYSLEVEKDLEGDKGLEDSLKVWELTKAGDTYYLAAGKAFQRGRDADQWEEIGPPDEGMLTSDIEFFNDTVYAIFRTRDGATSRLYSYNAGSGSWDEEDSISGDSNERIAGLLVVESGLYASVLKEDLDTPSNPYTLYYSDDGSDYTRVDLPGDDDYSVRTVFDGTFDGTNYWFISGSDIFSGTDPAILTTSVDLYDSDGNNITPTDFGGIYFCEELDKIFLSTQDGVIFVKNQPGLAGNIVTSNWYNSSRIEKGDSGEVFYDFIKIPASRYDDTGAVVVIVGSDTGYYEIEIDDADDSDSLTIKRPRGSTETTSINYLNTSLSESSIRSFAYDERSNGGGDDVIFACTTSSGLWRNTYNEDSDQRTWSRE